MAIVPRASATDSAAALDWLRATMRHEPALAASLRDARDDAGFAAVATTLAGQRGVRLDAGAIAEAVAQARRDHHRLSAATVAGLGGGVLFTGAPQGEAPAPPTCSATDVAGLCPVAIGLLGGAVLVEWCDMRGLPWDEPFFSMTVSGALYEPYRALSLRWTTLDALLADGADGGPDCLIFHVSRCGSTLLSRVLGGLPGGRAISEAPLIEELTATDTLDEPTRCNALRAAVGALLRRDAPGPRELVHGPGGRPPGPSVIKLDAWSVLDIGTLTRAFPRARRVFVYRDPREVIASQMRMRGAHMIPGVIAGGHPPLQRADVRTAEEHCAAVLDRFARAALSGLDDGDLLINYAELPGAIASRVLPHLGLSASPRMQRSIELLAAQDAKSPDLPFDPARHAAERPITAAIEAAARRLAWSSYELLEARRVAQLRPRSRPC